MNPHPLATLRFEAAGPKIRFEPFERHWYHVPRVGDAVEIDLQGNGEEIVRGSVGAVVWCESHVLVRLV
jgi:hypothetical protein